jgi:hypothetical protein
MFHVKQSLLLRGTKVTWQSQLYNFPPLNKELVPARLPKLGAGRNDYIGEGARGFWIFETLIFVGV